MTHFLRPLRRLLCILSLLAFAGVSHAVSVHGTVTDTLGVPIVGAVVALVHNGKVVVSVQTGYDGSYTLVSADSGRFYVLASGHSFRQLQTQSFFGQTLDDVEQNVVLEPEWVRQSVVVTATGVEMATLPGTTMNRPGPAPDGGTPGMTRLVAGAAEAGSQPAPPCEALSDTSAATRPAVVLTLIATTLAPPASDDSDWTTSWCGGTVIPVYADVWAGPASVITDTSTVAARTSTFIRSSWICPTLSC